MYYITIFFVGVTHAEDLLFLFYPHIIKEFNLSSLLTNLDDYKMIDCLTQMWTNFAKTGCEELIFLN